MAPSPEQDKEPKAPDKTQLQTPDCASNDTTTQPVDVPLVSDAAGSTSGHSVDTEKSEQLESLDESQLRILLDEAATYRRPKDREGKSLLFKELLQKAEQDSEAEWGPQCYRRARRSLGGGGGGGRRNGTRPPLTHSGSLQDLAEGGGVGGGGSGSVGVGSGGRSGVGARSKHRQGRASRQVSARSQQGGSLPSNVDQQHNLSGVEGGRSFLEDVRCGVGGGVSGSVGGGDYIATVHCVNPPTGYFYPHHRADSPPHRYYTTEDLDIRSQASSHVSVNYTSRATLEIGSPALDMDTSITSTSTNNSSNTSAGGQSTDQISIGEELIGNNNSCNISHCDSMLSSSPVASSPLSTGGSIISSCPLQLASTYCSVKSVVGDEAPPVSVMSQGGSLTTTTTVTSSVSRPITTASTASSHLSFVASCNMMPRLSSYQSGKLDSTDFKKSLDENGNAVQSATIGAAGLTIKKTKKKKCKNETETLSNEIDGYRGTEHINDILKFIESDAGDAAKSKTSNGSKTNNSFNSKPSGKEGKSKDDSHEKGAKKRSSDRRGKDGMDKLKKSNSMEELSRSKLDDLTSTNLTKDSLSLRKTKKHSAFDHSEISDIKRTDRRSWGNDGSDAYYHDNNDDSLSINTSNSSSSQSSVSGKGKKPKISPRPVEADPVVLGVETALEAADFQTVTNKKKIRKRHSPVDEGRGKMNGGNNSHGHTNHNKNGRFNGNFNNHDRDTRRNNERRHTSVSSPPSDSNDDLESVHSLCGEASGEKVQASYADMARAASQRLSSAITPLAPPPAVSPPPPPPPPNLVTPAPQRQHNFPDLIESCNYYSNDGNMKEKYLDVSTENTKNLMLKECPPVEATANHTSHPIYSHEQYPALEPRQRTANSNAKNPLHKSNSVGVRSNCNNINNVSSGNSNNNSSNSAKTMSLVKGTPNSAVGAVSSNGEKKALAKANSLKDTCLIGEEGSESSRDYYVAYVEHSTTNNSSSTEKHHAASIHNCSDMDSLSYMDNRNTNSSKVIKFSSNSKIDNFISKPPDVVLPITEMNQLQQVDCSANRPPVIILNEELKKSNENSRDIDGITFGFDINEQLLNGDNNCTSNYDSNDISNISDNNIINNLNNNNEATDISDVNSDKSISETLGAEEVTTMLIYNSTDFPPINQQQKAKRGVAGTTSSLPCDGEEANGAAGLLHIGASKGLALRYLPPPDLSHAATDSYNLERLVHYVGMAWEDTIKSPGGKVRYYSE